MSICAYHGVGAAGTRDVVVAVDCRERRHRFVFLATRIAGGTWSTLHFFERERAGGIETRELLKGCSVGSERCGAGVAGEEAGAKLSRRLKMTDWT